MAVSCKNSISEQSYSDFNLITQSKGPDLGYSPDSGVTILHLDGYAFKDLNKNGELDIYEDWRRSVDERAIDLASQLSIDQICGLMLYSSAVSVVSGRYEPSALLPCQLPSDMHTVEEQCEDLPFDMNCYVDTDGNTYDFAFGLNWKGVINDKRVEKYGHRQNILL